MRDREIRDLVVGADVGGTSTRVGVADLNGRVLRRAQGGAGNPNSVGVAGAATQIRDVIDIALQGVDGTVVSVVVGLAGGTRVATDADFLSSVVPARVATRAVIVGDLTVAFCSATAQREGYVAIAGTGAVAGHVVNEVIVQQSDGWGWLLGDQGSGLWLGRAAVQSTLEALQQGSHLGPLHRAVLSATRTDGLLALLAACYARHPTWLAELAPLVSEHSGSDPAAAQIGAEAAAKLATMLLRLDPLPGLPIVLAGSVLTSPGPVSAGFAAAVGRLPNPLLRSSGGVVGALWIACRQRVRDDPAVHARLVETTPAP